MTSIWKPTIYSTKWLKRSSCISITTIRIIVSLWSSARHHMMTRVLLTSSNISPAVEVRNLQSSFFNLTSTDPGEKYPVRDPFFKMIKRSLNTYMNAWTGPDFTCYPFSSANAKDFRNLMEVYMANTFSPLLRKSDFQQEGWRYDLEKETG